MHDKKKALEHFKSKGFDAEIQDGILYIYYDDIHNSEQLPDIVRDEVRDIEYGCSFGIKGREKRRKRPDEFVDSEEAVKSWKQ